MIKIENAMGVVEITQEYFAKLVAHAASECFGVAGMAISSASQGLREIVTGKEVADKGVQVRVSGKRLVIDLHIIVAFGVNIAAITQSIVHKVSYTVEEATGFEVARVNVFVDGIQKQ